MKITSTALARVCMALLLLYPVSAILVLRWPLRRSASGA